MSALKSYDVLSRLRRDGVVYSPKGKNRVVEMAEDAAAPLLKLKVIAEREEPTLVDLLKSLRKNGHDIFEMHMDEFGKLAGTAGRGIRRPQVNAALEEIANDDAQSQSDE